MRSWPAAPVPTVPESFGTAAAHRLQLHDTACGQLRDVPVPVDAPARLYVCGITPYDATHLGHAATYLAFDLLVRAWLDRGLAVEHVQNVTDVDDPLLERARRDGEPWTEVAERETERFRQDMTALRILPPQHYLGAVETIPEVVELVERLLDAGAAYRVPGPHGDDVYFSVAAAPHFGQVAGLPTDAMLALSAERGGDPERPGKKDPLDPVLWLAARPDEPSWESPLGAGRPGWHVECAAIALDRLGQPFDVQGGGSDLTFPHHEMSAAHAEAASGTWPFARLYAHAGMVGLDGEKMSKSKGNLVFVSQLRAASEDPMAVRLALLAQHYRADWSWTADTLEAGRARLGRWRTGTTRAAGPDAAAVVEQVRAALAADLDAPVALAAVDSWCEADGTDERSPAAVAALADALLGVRLQP